MEFTLECSRCGEQFGPEKHDICSLLALAPFFVADHYGSGFDPDFIFGDVNEEDLTDDGKWGVHSSGYNFLHTNVAQLGQSCLYIKGCTDDSKNMKESLTTNKRCKYAAGKGLFDSSELYLNEIDFDSIDMSKERGYSNELINALRFDMNNNSDINKDLACVRQNTDLLHALFEVQRDAHFVYWSLYKRNKEPTRMYEGEMHQLSYSDFIDDYGKAKAKDPEHFAEINDDTLSEGFLHLQGWFGLVSTLQANHKHTILERYGEQIFTEEEIMAMPGIDKCHKKYVDKQLEAFHDDEQHMSNDDFPLKMALLNPKGLKKEDRKDLARNFYFFYQGEKRSPDAFHSLRGNVSTTD